MRGNIKITVEVTDDLGAFPITETYSIGRDNTYETLDEWVEVFKKVLYIVGFAEGSIREVFEGEEC